MKNLIKGSIAGLVVGFVAGCYVPANTFSQYDTEIRAVAITTKLFYGVCPNKSGELTIRDSYLSNVNNVVEKSYILKNFDGIFREECKEHTLVTPPVSSEE